MSGRAPVKTLAEDHARMNILRERRLRKWTQVYIAKRVGLTATAITKIEKGTRGISLDEAAGFAAAFGVGIAQLVGEQEGVADERAQRNIVALAQVADLVAQLRAVLRRHAVAVLLLDGHAASCHALSARRQVRPEPGHSAGFPHVRGVNVNTVSECLETAQRHLENADDELDLVKQQASIALGNAWVDFANAVMELSRQ